MSDIQGLPRHRVAVVVFAEVEATDACDASYIVEQTLHQLGAYPTAVINTKLRAELPARNVTVHRVMDAGMAVGNGYLWLEPTLKAFPRE
jgi:hypothetical protein